ncbi:MAG: aminopeptidase [Lachnospiraceae bacterium]|nr:aminopeptidase [Lachnospiraceae bacterium]
MITEKQLKRYAELIVRLGANVQKGHKVIIRIAVDQYEFAHMLVEECYKAGASRVTVDWDDAAKSRLDYSYADEEVLGTLLPWEFAKLEQMEKDLPCMIRILSDDPGAMEGIDSKKLAAVMQRRAAASKPYNDRMMGKYHWVAAAVPSKGWAKKCFPDDTEEEAFSKLWDAILTTTRMNGPEDPLEAWNRHLGALKARTEWLNAQNFTSLVYKADNGTDFRVELIPGGLWVSAVQMSSLTGAEYLPNMPTEEIFTTPFAGKAEGTLVSSKPLSWNGGIIDDFSITFEKGRAVSCHAQKGQDLLEFMLGMDEGAARLGEVALVPFESPINKCGFLFYNTLFDENAVCHVAVGRGFPEVLEDGENISPEERTERGINDSMIHVDFMVGTRDLMIKGVRADGSETVIFENGTWKLSLDQLK